MGMLMWRWRQMNVWKSLVMMMMSLCSYSGLLLKGGSRVLPGGVRGFAPPHRCWSRSAVIGRCRRRHSNLLFRTIRSSSAVGEASRTTLLRRLTHQQARTLPPPHTAATTSRKQRRLWSSSHTIQQAADDDATIITDTDTATTSGSESEQEEEEEGEDEIIDTTVALRKGRPDGFYVVQEYVYTPLTSTTETTTTTHATSSWLPVDAGIDEKQVERLNLAPYNVTLPVALILVDQKSYPSLSNARKACRSGTILIERCTGCTGKQKKKKKDDNDGGDSEDGGDDVKESPSILVGRVGDRVYPGDKICRQVRMGRGYFLQPFHKQPKFDLPIVYEDNHMALVNKPPGVVVYRQGAGADGMMSVRAKLPFVLQAPKCGTYAVLKRPSSVHRIDKPTSGLLCVVKTKPAMNSLTRQFHDRIIQKTYMAIINGIPEENGISITSQEVATQLGLLDVDHDPNDDTTTTQWQVIDVPLDEKHAVTYWRAIRYVPSIHAHDGFLTLVELKPKTGRFHQLRRHMAWVCQRPLVGDKTYDGNTESAREFRERGLFLCASRITLEHPYFNTDEGRMEWKEQQAARQQQNTDDDECANMLFADAKLWYSEGNDKVMLSASLHLPNKFQSLLNNEERRYRKFSSDDTATVTADNNSSSSSRQ